jgi:hypothetical protein
MSVGVDDPLQWIAAVDEWLEVTRIDQLLEVAQVLANPCLKAVLKRTSVANPRSGGSLDGKGQQAEGGAACTN